ncbi:MAG: hypothetical protein U0132_07330 [Gemmatimonadaceae bacterium]
MRTVSPFDERWEQPRVIQQFIEAMVPQRRFYALLFLVRTMRQ